MVCRPRAHHEQLQTRQDLRALEPRTHRSISAHAHPKRNNRIGRQCDGHGRQRDRLAVSFTPTTAATPAADATVMTIAAVLMPEPADAPTEAAPVAAAIAAPAVTVRPVTDAPAAT